MVNYEVIVSASVSFCASLTLSALNSDCGKEHGYTFKITAFVYIEQKQKDCFILDYSVLQSSLGAICKQLDYSNLNKNPLLKNIEPFSENIAKWLIEQLEQDLVAKEVNYQKVQVKIITKPGCAVTVGMKS